MTAVISGDNDDVTTNDLVKKFQQATGTVYGRFMISVDDLDSAYKTMSSLLPLVNEAAEKANVHAQFALSRYYRDNNAVCVSWAQRAANQGHPVAMANLGDYYLRGRKGLQQDLDKAAELFAFALASGDVDAAEMITEQEMKDFPQIRAKINAIQQDPGFKDKLSFTKQINDDRKSLLGKVESYIANCKMRKNVFDRLGSLFGMSDLQEQIEAAGNLKVALQDEHVSLSEEHKRSLLNGDFAKVLGQYESRFGSLWKESMTAKPGLP